MKTATLAILTLTMLCAWTIVPVQGKQPKEKARGLDFCEQLHEGHFFKQILDTVEIKPLSHEFLIANEWIYKPTDVHNCNSHLKFAEKGRGRNYDCELEENFEVIYKIKKKKLLIAQYGIPNIDNPQNQKIKLRDDTYVYNGHALIMVGSRMYGISGYSRIPVISLPIKYERKN